MPNFAMRNGQCKRDSAGKLKSRVERVARFDSQDGGEEIVEWVTPHASGHRDADKREWSACALLKKVGVDVVIFTGMFAAALLMYLYIEPRYVGFFCDDQSLFYPHKPETITTGILLAIAITIPIFTICVTEILCQRTINPKTNAKMLRGTARNCAVFGFGFIVNQLLIEIGKSALGKLRPNFMAVCDPDVGSNCSKRFVLDYICLNTGGYPPSELRDVHRSLPSGHAAASMYGAVFAALYIHERVRLSFSRLLRPVLQTLLTSLSLYVSVTRVTDHRHHMSDIYVGWVIGITVAILTFFHVSLPLLRPQRQHPRLKSTTSMLTTYSTCSQDSQPTTPHTPTPLVFSPLPTQNIITID